MYTLCSRAAQGLRLGIAHFSITWHDIEMVYQGVPNYDTVGILNESVCNCAYVCPVVVYAA